MLSPGVGHAKTRVCAIPLVAKEHARVDETIDQGAAQRGGVGVFDDVNPTSPTDVENRSAEVTCGANDHAAEDAAEGHAHVAHLVAVKGQVAAGAGGGTCLHGLFETEDIEDRLTEVVAGGREVGGEDRCEALGRRAGARGAVTSEGRCVGHLHGAAAVGHPVDGDGGEAAQGKLRSDRHDIVL